MRIEIHEGEDAAWYLRLVASNGRITLDSEGYSSKSNAKRAARRMKALLAMPTWVRIVEV